MIGKIAELLLAKGITVKDAPDRLLNLRFPDYRGCKNFWQLIVNGGPLRKNVEAEQWGEIEVGPYEFVIFWNGWLAGKMSAGGGQMAAHPEGANEETFLKSLEAFSK